MPPMSGRDRAKVLIKLIIVIGIIAVAVIGIFQAVPNNVGGDHNECPHGNCGRGNDGDRIGEVGPSK